MEMIFQGMLQALQRLAVGDGEIIEITLLSIGISAAATLISIVLGIPLGMRLALKEFPGKAPVISLVNLGMGAPPVVVGLLVSLMFWRYGPLGDLGIMYTPSVMIIAQALIAFPIVAGLTFAAIMSLERKLRWQIVSLGATSRQTSWLLMKEAKLGLMAAVIAGFGRVIAEVGASMMVGGNIKGQTRVLTTATVMEVGKGNYDSAIAMSFILLITAFWVVAVLTWLQHGGKEEKR